MQIALDPMMDEQDNYAVSIVLGLIVPHLENPRGILVYKHSSNYVRIIGVCDKRNIKNINQDLPRNAYYHDGTLSSNTRQFYVDIVIDQFLREVA